MVAAVVSLIRAILNIFTFQVSKCQKFVEKLNCYSGYFTDISLFLFSRLTCDDQTLASNDPMISAQNDEHDEDDDDERMLDVVSVGVVDTAITVDTGPVPHVTVTTVTMWSMRHGHHMTVPTWLHGHWTTVGVLWNVTEMSLNLSLNFGAS